MQALHDVLHPGCSDPQCYFKSLWRGAAAGLGRGERTEREAYDPVLKRHFSILVQPLVRPPRPLREAGDLHAVVMMSDISDIKQAEAGYQHLFQELECMVCLEKERREFSEGMQARLLTILERTTDYIAMADAKGGMLYLNPAGRALLGLGPHDDISHMKLCEHGDQEAKDRIWREAIPSAIREVVQRRRARGAGAAQDLPLPRRQCLGHADASRARSAQLVAEGHPNRYISDYLCLSIKTVEKHRSNLMMKLGLHNAFDADQLRGRERPGRH